MKIFSKYFGIIVFIICFFIQNLVNVLWAQQEVNTNSPVTLKELGSDRPWQVSDQISVTHEDLAQPELLAHFTRFKAQNCTGIVLCLMHRTFKQLLTPCVQDTTLRLRIAIWPLPESSPSKYLTLRSLASELNCRKPPLDARHARPPLPAATRGITSWNLQK